MIILILILLILLILPVPYYHSDFFIDNFLAISSNTDSFHKAGLGNMIMYKLRIDIRRSLGYPIVTDLVTRYKEFDEPFEITPSELTELRTYPRGIFRIPLTRSMWLEANWSEQLNPYFAGFWDICRRILARRYDKVLPKVSVTEPVIHFRCSDIPFNKHHEYHIPKDGMLHWIAEELKVRGYKTAIILNCTKHLSEDGNDKYCKDFLDHYVGILTEHGISVRFQCKDLLEDFATMYYSPLLVSLNGSSFSLAAGMAKDPTKFITSNNGVEIDGKYVYSKGLSWKYYGGPPILHSEVANYRSKKIPWI